MIDKKPFVNIVIGLAANFGAQIPEGLLQLWLNTFTEDGISLEQIKIAAGKIIRSKKDGYGRMPTYAEFFEIIKGSDDDKALVTANEIIKHLHEHGSRVFPNLSDPIAKQLMTKRWPYYDWASQVLESELKWWVKDFCEAYHSYSTLEQVPHVLENAGAGGMIASVGNRLE